MFTQLSEYPNYRIYEEGYVISPNGKRLKVYRDKAGYCFVTMKNTEGVYKKVRLHRIVACAFISNPDNLPEVNHKDGDKANNAFINLEWVTSKQNKDHGWNMGLYRNKTQNHYAAVLTDLQVHDICVLLQLNISNSVIADKYNVDKSIIAHIKAGDTWKDISRMYSINRITKPRKSKEDIHSVCKCLSEGLSFEFILEKFPTFSRKDIYRIKNKQTYKTISELYFQ